MSNNQVEISLQPIATFRFQDGKLISVELDWGDSLCEIATELVYDDEGLNLQELIVERIDRLIQSLDFADVRDDL